MSMSINFHQVAYVTYEQQPLTVQETGRMFYSMTMTLWDKDHKELQEIAVIGNEQPIHVMMKEYYDVVRTGNRGTPTEEESRPRTNQGTLSSR